MQSINLSSPHFSVAPLDSSEILNTFLTEIDDAIESHTLKAKAKGLDVNSNVWAAEMRSIKTRAEKAMQELLHSGAQFMAADCYLITQKALEELSASQERFFAGHKVAEKLHAQATERHRCFQESTRSCSVELLTSKSSAAKKSAQGEMSPELKAETLALTKEVMANVRLITAGVELVETAVVEGTKYLLCGMPGSDGRKNCRAVASFAAEQGKAAITAVGLKEPIKMAINAWTSIDGSNTAAYLTSLDVPEDEAKQLAAEYISDIKHLSVASIPVVGFAAKKGLSYVGTKTLQVTPQIATKPPVLPRTSVAPRSLEIEVLQAPTAETIIATRTNGQASVTPLFSAEAEVQKLVAERHFTQMLSNLQQQAPRLSQFYGLPKELRAESSALGELYGSMHREVTFLNAEQSIAARELSIQSLWGNVAKLKEEIGPVLTRYIDERLLNPIIEQFQATLPQFTRSEYHRLLHAIDRESLAVGVPHTQLTRLREAFAEGYVKEHVAVLNQAEERFFDVYWSVRSLKEITKGLAQNNMPQVTETVLKDSVEAFSLKLASHNLMASRIFKEPTAIPSTVKIHDSIAAGKRYTEHMKKNHYNEAQAAERATREELKLSLPPMQKPARFPKTIAAYEALSPISGEGFEYVKLGNASIFKIELKKTMSPYPDIRRSLNSLPAASSERLFLFWDIKRYWDEYSLVSYFNSKKAIVGIDIIEGHGKTELVLLELKKGTKMPKLSS